MRFHGKWLSVFALGATLAGSGACAPRAAPKVCSLALTGRVVDSANILSPATEQQLTDQLRQLETSTSDQVVVATTPSMEGEDVLFYSVDLARCWNIGTKRLNNGLLVLVAPNEQKARIEVGRGLESILSDEEAKVIMKKDIIANFKLGKFDEGTKSGVTAILRALTDDSAAAAARLAATRENEVAR
jgi:uncharacterized protein